MDIKLSTEVQQRLDKINWDSLKEKYGISKESITQNPHVANQLAYGQMTDLVRGNTSELSGVFSLRAYPKGDGSEWAVKVYTMEKAKTVKDNITVYNQPITSERVKEALFERTSWTDQNGEKRTGLANANGGRPISLMLDGRKQDSGSRSPLIPSLHCSYSEEAMIFQGKELTRNRSGNPRRSMII